MLKNKAWLLVLWWVSIIVIWVVANYVFKWNTFLNDAINTVGNKFSSVVNLWSSKLETDYVWNLNVEFDIPAEKASWKLSMKWIQVASLDKNLKGKFAIQSIDWQLVWAPITWISIKDLDFTVDEEKIYFKIDSNSLKSVLSNPWMSWNQLVTKYIDALKAWKYLYVNWAAKNLKMLGKLWENELVKLLVVAMATWNPSYYLEKNGFEKKFRDKYLVKWAYVNYFEEVKTDWNKKFVKVKESICDDLWAIVKSMWESNPAMRGAEMDPTQCKWTISAMNAMMDWKLYVQQEWSKESIVYEWMFNLNIAYWDWKLDIFKVQMQSFGSIDYSSNKLKIDIVPEMLKYQWHDLAIKWDIDFANKATWTLWLTYKLASWSGEQSMWNWEANIVFNLDKWSIKDWTATAKIESNWAVLNIDWKWDSKAWNLTANVKVAEQEMWNLSFKYEWKSVDFVVTVPSAWLNINFKTVEKDWKLDITSNSKMLLPEWEFSLDINWNVQATDSNWNAIKSFDITTTFKNDTMQLNWTLKTKYQDWKLESSINVGQATSKAEFTLNWDLTKNKIDLKFDGKWMQDDKQIWVAQWNIKYENTASWSKNVFKWNVDFTLDWQKIFDIKFDWDYKKWWATYNVPTNYIEFDYEELVNSMMWGMMGWSDFWAWVDYNSSTWADMYYSWMNSLIEEWKGASLMITWDSIMNWSDTSIVTWNSEMSNDNWESTSVETITE